MVGRWFRRSGEGDGPNAAVAWPPLPTHGFIQGRSATAGDVERGEAVFCQQTDDQQAAEALPIAIPQYGLWTDEDGARHRVIVVQGERHVTDPGGEAVLGLRTLQGEEVIATEAEVELLGTEVPRRASA